jgi:hypothetical protein
MRCGRARLPIFVKAFAGRLACPIYPTLCVLVAEPRSGACQVPVTFISIRHQIYDPEWPFLAIAIEAHFDWCHGSSVRYEKSNLLNTANKPVAIAARKTVVGLRDLLSAICYSDTSLRRVAAVAAAWHAHCLSYSRTSGSLKGAAARLVGKSLSAIWGEHRQPSGGGRTNRAVPFLTHRGNSYPPHTDCFASPPISTPECRIREAPRLQRPNPAPH